MDPKTKNEKNEQFSILLQKMVNIKTTFIRRTENKIQILIFVFENQFKFDPKNCHS